MYERAETNNEYFQLTAATNRTVSCSAVTTRRSPPSQFSLNLISEITVTKSNQKSQIHVTCVHQLLLTSTHYLSCFLSSLSLCFLPSFLLSFFSYPHVFHPHPPFPSATVSLVPPPLLCSSNCATEVPVVNICSSILSTRPHPVPFLLYSL